MTQTSMALALAGISFLVRDKNYTVAVLLGAVLGYFIFLSGLSFWQGSRIYFPSGLASSILIAYAGYRIVLLLKR